MPNVVADLPNIGAAFCSTPQSSADAHYYSVQCGVVTLPRREASLNLQGCPKLANVS